MFPTKDIFEQVFLQVTDDFGCMVINNRLRSSEISKKVFWFKAQNRSHFKVGNNEIYIFHKKNLILIIIINFKY